MQSTLALLSAGAPKLVPRKQPAPVKYGFCVKCKQDDRQLRPSRVGVGGQWVYCNYCTECHRLSCLAYRRQNQKSLNQKRRERYERQKLQACQG